MNKIHLWLLIFLIVVLMFIVTGCSLLPNTSLEILQYNLENRVVEGELTAQMVGVARNDGSARLEYAEIEGNFYDKDGTLVYSSVASINNLDPGQIWEFTISYSSAAKDVHPYLNILSWDLEIDNSGARIISEAENNGDVILSFAEVTGTFYDAPGEELASGTVTTTKLGIGEIWKYTISYPAANFADVDHVKVEVSSTDYEPEPIQNVDHVTAEVGRLRGSTVMP